MNSSIKKMIESFAPFVGKNEIIVLPADDLLNGVVGFSIFTVFEEDGKQKELASNLQIQVLKPVSIGDREEVSKEKYEMLYSEFKDKDFLIQDHDDPIKLLKGLIVHKGSGSYYYYYRLKH